MSKIPLSLYKDSNKLEEAQLRSVLLFGRFGTKVAGEDYMYQRLVFSLMVEAGREMDLSDIQTLFSNGSLSSDLRNKDLKKMFDQLEKDGLIKMQPSGKYLAISEQQEGVSFFEQLDKDTDKLIDGVYHRFLNLHGNTTPVNQQVVKNRIRETLSVYMKLSGLTFFHLQKDDSSPKDALQALIGNNPDAESLHIVTAIGETLSNRNAEEETVLNQWAKAFIVTQILQLDPTLKHFKQDQLRNKTFVLDTDVVLRTLATHADFSKEYREILYYLKKLGCQIIVTNEIFKEAEGHAKEALNLASQIGEKQLRDYDELLLYGTKSNVFIKDYVHQVKNDPDKKDMTFDVYLGNIFNSRSPKVMKTRLAEVIGEDNVKLTLDMQPLEGEVEEKLNALILERTATSPKGQERTDSFNEKVARNDTKLFLTLVNYNHVGSPDEDGLLPYKYYLLTHSTRTILSAKELGIYEDIICKPQALTVVLNELGDISDDEVNFINLFENPFLVHVADQIWERIKPLIESGAPIYHADIQQLKAKVDLRFDGMLTGDGKAFNIDKLKELEKSGFLFPGELLRVVEENQKLKQNVEVQKLEIEKRDAEIEKKDNHIRRLSYEERVRSGGKRKKRKFKRRNH